MLTFLLNSIWYDVLAAATKLKTTTSFQVLRTACRSAVITQTYSLTAEGPRRKQRLTDKVQTEPVECTERLKGNKYIAGKFTTCCHVPALSLVNLNMSCYTLARPFAIPFYG